MGLIKDSTVKAIKKMIKKEPTLEEWLCWVYKLDDPYKIFLFSLLNAIFFFVSLTYGQNIDPDAIKEMVLGTLVGQTKNQFLIDLWGNIVKPILAISGIIQSIISLYAIYKHGVLGIIIAATGFAGWLLALSQSHYGWPTELFWASVVLIFVSGGLAIATSKLKFDKDGKVIYDG